MPPTVPASSPSTEPSTSSDRRHRLPRTVLPRHYRIHLEPDLDAARFTGSVHIEVEVTEPTSTIVVNSAELEIAAAHVNVSHNDRIATVAPDEENERVALSVPDPLPVGPATVVVEFSGVLNDKLRGFYRSTFVDDDGTEQVIATTQFESTDARRAFPCFDEPDLKASFGVTLVVADGLAAFSNAAQIEQKPRRDGRVEVRFADTMVMSTYLVAFVVGPLEITGPTMVGHTPIRIIHPPGRGHLALYPLETAAAALEFFETYYGIDYPGDKLDLVAVPDFAFGAMENLGCVIFREALLLVDPQQVTQQELQRVADVINHELAHMWFGDLVTMRWWNGIWLNEAFATFMEMSATHHQRPDWKRWVSFGLERASALDTDSLASTRPVEFPVRSPEEAEGMFDVLTYEKGAALVRMLEQHLGAERFRTAVGTYLRTHEYGNTETGDLWDALEASTGEPVRALMDSWIFHEGYPVIDVALGGDDGTLTLTQERFLVGDESNDSASDAGDSGGHLWHVPVTVATQADGAQQLERLVLDQAATTIDLGYRPERVHVNMGGHGFYRVRYPAELRRGLLEDVQSMTALERLAVVDDTWALVLRGDLAATEFVDLSRDLSPTEDDHAVWTRVLAGLDMCHRLTGPEPFATQLLEIIGPIRERLGPTSHDGEDDLTRQLRADLLAVAGTLGQDQQAVTEAHRIHDGSGDSVGPSGDVAPMVAAAVRVLAGTGDATRFDDFRRRAQQAPTPQDQLRYLYSLATFPDESLVLSAVDLALTDEVRSQNTAFLIARAIEHRRHGPAAWKRARDRWSEIEGKLPSMLMVRLASGVRSITDRATAEDISAFFDDHPLPQAEKTLAQHLEKMHIHVMLRERESERLAAALR